MKNITRILIAALALVTAIPAVAQQRRIDKRTIVVRDGKVLDLGDMVGGKRAFLGVGLTDISSELRDYFGAAKHGVLVGSVEDNSPADKAGLRVGDVITAVDGDDIDSSWDLRRALREKKQGDSVRLDVVRNKAKQTVVATVVEKDFNVDMIIPPDVRANLDRLPRRMEVFSSPEFRARIEGLEECGDLQMRIRELETRLKDLEKKLQK